MPVLDIKPFEGYAGAEDAEYAQMCDYIEHAERAQARIVAEWCLEHLRPRLVIDCGCGPGTYLLDFQKAECEIVGLDACSGGGRALPHGAYWRIDLRLPFHTTHSLFDLCLCIEVAEHLEEEYADTLIDTLCQFSSTVFFTAAGPGQPGVFHKNCQPREYWIEKFAARGYALHALNGALREHLAGTQDPDTFGWLRSNAMLFTKAA